MVLAPGGLGNMFSLIIAGQLVARIDQRLLLGTGAALNVVALLWMSNLTLSVDYWSLAWPRLLQGFGMGFIFVPLQTLALSTVRLDRLGNATAAYNVVRNVGGSLGIATVTTLLARRTQYHQAMLVERADITNPLTSGRLREWTAHFSAQGADPVTAGQQAMDMLYRQVTDQAQVKAFIDDLWLLTLLFVAILLLVPLMRRVRVEETERREPERPGRVEGLPAASE
jgi:DHA2 family multidrug resistance protein